jgi:TonB family protein
MHRYLAPLILLACTTLLVAQDNQKNGETLLTRAQDATDIRSAQSEPFRLTYQFHFVRAKIGESTNAEYREVWNSSDHWRREITVADFRQIEVGGKEKRSIQRDLMTEPAAVRIMREMTIIRSIKIGKVTQLSPAHYGSAQAQCVTSQMKDFERTLCFDSTTGLLVQHKMSDGESDETCQFTYYQKFGTKILPHKLHCSTSLGLVIDAELTKLSGEDAVDDPALFAPLTGATEWPVCDNVEPPRPAYHWTYPRLGIGAMLATGVRVSFVVGVDGKPSNIKVAHSAGKHHDNGAVGVVKRWKYKPATCAGAPIPYAVEVVFR